jgi:hypothetical protein
MSNLATINKAVTAGVAAGGAMFWQLQPTLGVWHALVPAVVTAAVIGFLTWAVPNGKLADFAVLARQLEAALHINAIVANTPPVEPATDPFAVQPPVIKP